MNIIVGSTSKQKIDAVTKACRELGITATVTGTKTRSGQNEQPVGYYETLSGAITRARGAQEEFPDTVAIGIESGIFDISSVSPVTVDKAVIVIILPDGQQIITTSPGVVFPQECIEIAAERGFETTTVGSVIAEKLGGDPADPHATLTKGKVTREMTLVAALKIALAQL